ncbi:MAG: alpha/beta hydrolase [Polyangiaceae bacterium]
MILALTTGAGCNRVSGRGGDEASASPVPPASEPPPSGGQPASGGPIRRVSSCVLPGVPDSSTFQEAKDVVFSKASGQALRLDIAWPKQGGPHKLVVLVHGGGWGDGGKSWYESEIESLAALGYVAASVDYRLAEEQNNVFPAAVQDVRCALRWLVASKDQYAIEPRRVALVGGSAGGQLAALVASAANEEAFDGACATSGPVPPIAAVVAISAPFDLRASAFGGHQEGQWDVATFLGAPARERAAQAARASPITHIDRADPPVLLIHGTDDATVPVSESRHYGGALAKAGVKSLLVEIATDQHAFSPLAPEDVYRSSTCTVLEFLAKHL